MGGGGFLGRLLSYLASGFKGLCVYTGDFLFLCADGRIFLYFFLNTTLWDSLGTGWGVIMRLAETDWQIWTGTALI